MTKQECLSKLDSIIESTCSQAIYITACNYYDTVSNLTEEEFDTVADWYENSNIIKNIKTTQKMKAKQLPNPPEVIYFDINTIKTKQQKNKK